VARNRRVAGRHAPDTKNAPAGIVSVSAALSKKVNSMDHRSATTRGELRSRVGSCTIRSSLRPSPSRPRLEPPSTDYGLSGICRSRATFSRSERKIGKVVGGFAVI
jgi:hypothetical protein